jgi:hypothetical protein
MAVWRFVALRLGRRFAPETREPEARENAKTAVGAASENPRRRARTASQHALEQRVTSPNVFATQIDI